MIHIYLPVFILVNLFSWGAEGGNILPAKKPDVVTTLFPTYDFARQIGKDRVNISLLIPPGVEAHTFEPKPGDIVRLSKADLFIYTGKYMEPWVEDLIKGVSNKNLMVVDASRGIQLDDEAGHDGKADGHRHNNGEDPHIWLDLHNAQVMADTVARSLALKDPANKEFYFQNAQGYKARLADMDSRFARTFSDCKHKTIIYGGHFAFGYFAKRYGLKYMSPYSGFSPNAEPSPKAIADLIKGLRGSGIKCIYHEELLDPKVARIIASETGAKPILLHGAHNISKEELHNGITYCDIMERNLQNLKTGLECK